MKKLLLTFLSVSLVWGCGGGGSGDSPEAPVVSGGALSITWNMSQSTSAEENSNAATLIDATLNNSTAQLSFSLSGTDSNKFSISNGYIVFTDLPDYENPLDSNSDNSYSLTINASAAGISSTHSFTVNVTNVNEAPVFVTDSSSYFKIEENTTLVKQIEASDPETDTLTFSIQDSSGTEDDNLLQIDSTTGEISFKSAPNFEVPGDIGSDNLLTFTVVVTDGNLTTTKKYFTEVTNVNESATDIALSGSTVIENISGAIFGNFSLVDEDANSGIQDLTIIPNPDSHLFAIGGDLELRFIEGFSADFEVQNSYSITLEITDKDGTNLRKTFELSISDANDSPTSVSITGGSAAENSAGASFGTLSTTDPDASDTFTYSVTGGTDSASFEIGSSNNLKFKSTVSGNYESKSSYSVIVTSTDAGSNTYAETLTVSITNVNEAPAFTTSSSISAAENDTSVVTAAASDPESGSMTYSLGTGNDTSKFSITSAGVLTFNRAPDYEIPSDSDENNTYLVNLIVSDGTNSTTLTMTITVTDVTEATALETPDAVQTVETK